MREGMNWTELDLLALLGWASRVLVYIFFMALEKMLCLSDVRVSKYSALSVFSVLIREVIVVAPTSSSDALLPE